MPRGIDARPGAFAIRGAFSMDTSNKRGNIERKRGTRSSATRARRNDRDLLKNVIAAGRAWATLSAREAARCGARG